MRAAWSSEDAQWTVEIERDGGDALQLRCRFLLMCSGYYDYAAGYLPDFPGRERFAGRVVHPQHWPDDIDYAGKRVVVIGSGATAVTLVPELAARGGARDHAAALADLDGGPPVGRPVGRLAAAPARARLAHGAARWKNLLFGMYVFSCAGASRSASARR